MTEPEFRRLVTVVVVATAAAELARVSVGMLCGLLLRRQRRRAVHIAPHVDTPR